ncbi:hypothetical protein ACW0JT_10940 [Arthrobacter sp. SA17]
MEPGFPRGRIIIPGTARQLGAFGLFRPSPSQGQAHGRTVSKHAEGGVLWISLGELLEQNIPLPELTDLADAYRTWVLDAHTPEILSRSSPVAKRFVDVAAVLERCDVTVFIVSASPLPLGSDNPFSTLEVVESSEALPVEGVHGS